MVTIAKAEEEAVILDEPGIVTNVDLANTVYTIPEGGEEETPTMEQDEALKSDTDSDVSIEPYMAEWKHQQAMEAPFSGHGFLRYRVNLLNSCCGRLEYSTNNL